MDFGLALLKLCLSLLLIFFTYTSQRMRTRGFGRNRPLISILVSGIGESGDGDEVQLVVVLSYKFAGLEWNSGVIQHSAPPKLSRWKKMMTSMVVSRWGQQKKK